MKVLGLSLGILSTAAILVDDKIVFCASEERFSRVKNDEQYPRKSIEFVLKEANIKFGELDKVVIAGTSLNLNTHLMRKYSSWSISDQFRLMDEFWRRKLLFGETPNYNEIFKEKIDTKQFPGENKWNSFLQTISKDYYDIKDNDKYKNFLHDMVVFTTGIEKSNIIHLDHHSCHASYAYWASPLRGQETLIMTGDAFGDGYSSTLSTINNRGNIECKHQVPADEFILGRLYRHITLLMGMMPDAHEYKIMGLAPYSKLETLTQAYNVFKDGMYVDGIDFKWNKKPSDLFFWYKERLEQCRFDGIAGGLQKYLEEILVEYTTNALKKYNCNKLVFSGGLSMNVKANMLIKDIVGLDEMFVPPSGGDESLAIGACYAYLDQIEKKTNLLPLENAYLGPDVNKEDIDIVLKDAKKDGFKVEIANNEKIADLLIQGRVVGRCVGRMEFGARSLGNRSIIADPRSSKIVQVINEKIKNRDFWMPFAPSIITESEYEMIINEKNLQAPYMTIAFDSTAFGRDKLSAACHPSDRTLRPHIVSQSSNKKYHDLISTFKNKTGVGGLLNTSFNLHGHPVVNSSQDAYDVFKKTDIDVLLFETHFIVK